MSRASSLLSPSSWPLAARVGAFVAFVAAALCHIDRIRFLGWDLFWHLRLGQQILETGRIAQTDVMTFSRYGQPFVNAQWITDVLYFELFGIGQGTGLLVFRTVVAALIVLLLFGAAGGWKKFQAYPVVLLSVLILRPYLAFRTQTTTLLFVALLVFLAARGIKRPWILPILFAIWANFHGGFPIGLALLGAWWFGELLDDAGWTDFLKHMAVLATCALATLLNPFGVKVWTMALGLGLRFSPQMSDWLPLWEFPVLSRSFHHLTLCWLTVVLLFATAVFSWTRLPKRELMPALLFAVLAVAYVRLVPSFGLVAVPALARIALLLAPVDNGRWPGRVVRVAGLLAMAAFCLVALVRGPVRTLRLDPSPDHHPVQVVRYLEREGISGNILNSLEWGGYLAWELPDSKIFIDGRTGTLLYGRQIWLDWQSLREATNDWRALLSRYPIDLVLVRPTTPLASRLEDDTSWEKIASDATAVCFRRRSRD